MCWDITITVSIRGEKLPPCKSSNDVYVFFTWVNSELQVVFSVSGISGLLVFFTVEQIKSKSTLQIRIWVIPYKVYGLVGCSENDGLTTLTFGYDIKHTSCKVYLAVD